MCYRAPYGSAFTTTPTLAGKRWQNGLTVGYPTTSEFSGKTVVASKRAMRRSPANTQTRFLQGLAKAASGSLPRHFDPGKEAAFARQPRRNFYRN
jgi:hypothetical protein